MCVCVPIHTYLPTYLLTYLSVCRSVYLYLSIYLSINQSICLSTCQHYIHLLSTTTSGTLHTYPTVSLSLPFFAFPSHVYLLPPLFLIPAPSIFFLTFILTFHLFSISSTPIAAHPAVLSFSFPPFLFLSPFLSHFSFFSFYSSHHCPSSVLLYLLHIFLIVFSSLCLLTSFYSQLLLSVFLVIFASSSFLSF